MTPSQSFRLTAAAAFAVLLAGCSSASTSGEKPTFELSVATDGLGSGRITSTPPALECFSRNGIASGACSVLFDSGVAVQVLSTATTGSRFIGWTGGCGGSGGCQIRMTQDRSIGARFETIPTSGTHSLSVSLSGNGSGSVVSSPVGISCTSSSGRVSGSCVANSTTPVTYGLTASIPFGSSFGGWSGACSGTALTCTISAIGSVEASAEFRALTTSRITIVGSGTGDGRVTSQPPGINCYLSNGVASGACTGVFAANSVVTLAQEPSSSSAFGGWTGSCGSFATCGVQVGTRDSTVGARFDLANAFRATDVALGALFSCATSQAGQTYCWGSNSLGQLGIGSVNAGNFNSPQRLSVSDGSLLSTAKSSHICAISNGQARCWGWNGTGQLGDGTVSQATRPIEVLGGQSFSAMSAGSDHTCGVSTSGVAFCWGLNNDGRLGDSTLTRSTVPRRVWGSFTFSQIALGASHTCGLRTDGAIACWGSRASGAAGGPVSSAGYRIPTVIPGANLYRQVVAGGDFTCGLTTAGLAFCWGNNDVGQLGNGSLAASGTPTLSASGRVFEQLAAGNNHACGLSPNGDVYCWGWGADGQLGSGATQGINQSPVRVTGGISFRRIAAGLLHTCGIASTGSLYCWGSNSRGQLGTGRAAFSATPLPVQP